MIQNSQPLQVPIINKGRAEHGTQCTHIAKLWKYEALFEENIGLKIDIAVMNNRQ